MLSHYRYESVQTCQCYSLTDDIDVQVSAYQPGVSLMVDKSEVTTVSLLLQEVTTAHSGLWECRPDNAPPANLTIHVIKGETQLGLTLGHWDWSLGLGHNIKC